MTSFDTKLDFSLLPSETPLTLYRLTTRKYATSLSGLGAAVYAGRWNASGQEAIYTSTERGVCVLERLVHTPKNRIPSDLAMMTIELAGDWNRFDPQMALDKKTGQIQFSFNTLSEGLAWFQACNWSDDIVALVIPSIIVPVWNVVLYPRAKRFWDHVHLLSVEPFDYDPRLFPEESLSPEKNT